MNLFGNTKNSEFSNNVDEPFKYGSVELIKGDIRRKWEEALIRENFAYPNMFLDNLGKNKLDCSHEIDDMYSHSKITAFFENSEYDRINRMRILANYLHQSNWSNKALNRATIPYHSFVRSLIEKKARLYSKPAQRQIDDPDTNMSYQELICDANINSKMRLISQLVKAHDFVAVRPIVGWCEDDEEYQLSYDVITPDKFRVQLSADLSRITKILYESQMLNEAGGYYEDIIVVWTPESHYFWTCTGDQGTFDDSGKNPYGRIPYVIFRQNDDGQLYSSGAIELLHANLRYNHAVLNADYDSDISAMNVFVGKNLPMGKDASLHPGDVFIVQDTNQKDNQLPVEGKFVSTTPFFDRYQVQAKEIYKEIAMSQGIPGYMFSETIQELSGKAVKNSMIMLTDEMEADRLIYVEMEKKLALLTAHICNYHISAGQLDVKPIDPKKVKAGFYVDYQEDSFYDEDPSKNFMLDQQKVQSGIKSLVSWIQQENPDIVSAEEALEFYKGNQKQLDAFSKSGFRFYFEKPSTPETPTVDQTVVENPIEEAA